MKRTILFVSLITIAVSGLAQEYKVARSSGKLEIVEVNHVIIEGHSGNDIIFKSRTEKKKDDPRAVGLRPLSSLGLTDNSGLGLSVVENGNAIEVRQLRKTEGPRITILVPKGVTVSYRHSSPFGDKVEVQNFAGELDINTVHNSVKLTNVSGRVAIKTVHGHIDASLATPLTAAVAIESTHGHVDVALPVSTKANVTLGTEWGEVLVDPDFKIQLERTGDMQKFSSKIRGTVNGGGNEILLRSQHNNIYMRKI